MSKSLLIDYTPFEITPQMINESESKNNGRVIVTGCLQRAEAKNQNGRVYPKEILLREVANYKKVQNCNIKKAIGYQEIDDYLKNKISLSDMSKTIISNTRKYSKRQFTWFNNRYEEQIKVDSYKKSSLILETLSKIT